MSQKRLYLSKDKVIGGVAGGVAEYLNVDPTIVRLLFALSIFAGFGPVAYIAGMFIIPERPRDVGPTTNPDSENEAIEDLKHAAKQLANASGEVAHDVASRIKNSVEKLSAERKPERENVTSPENSRNLGIILLAIGLIFLARTFIPWVSWGTMLPIVLIAGGFLLIFKGLGGR